MTDINKTFKIYGDNEGILYLEFLGNVQSVSENVAQADQIAKKLEQIFNDNLEKKFNLVVDLSAVSQSAHYPSPRARRIFASITDQAQLEKIAVIAPSALSRAIMSFVIRAMQTKKSIKFFADRSQALEWFK